MPQNASADHSIFHTVQQLQEQVSILQVRVNALAAVFLAVKPEDAGKPADTGKPAETGKPEDAGKSAEAPAQSAAPAVPSSEGGNGGASAQPATTPASPASPTEREEKIKNVQQQVQNLAKKVEELSAQVGLHKPSEPAGLAISSSLKRGSSGEDVRQLQGFLKKFPDIYPEGLETGYFGPASEKAIKKLQEEFGLKKTGFLDPQTRGKLNELASAVSRKQPPKISDIAPTEISANAVITLTGTGFTLENNSLFVRGKTILTGLASGDGTSIEFSLPTGIPCEIGQTCPVKIINSNGISNAKVFKLTDLVVPPTPEPISEPPPPPPPVPAPTIKDTVSPTRSDGSPSGTLPSDTTFATISLVTDENATCKYVADASGISYAEMPNTFSETNSTFHSSLVSVQAISPSYPTAYGFSVRCQDNTGNANTDDYSILFSVANKPLLPTITIISPNGGEAYKYGDAVTITWKAENITSKSAHIKLLKAGSVISTIASNVPQSEETGLFLYSWIVPSVLAVGSDYAIEVSDAASSTMKDTSDGQFKVASLVAVKLLRPNEGEVAMLGFKIPLIWEYNASVPSAGITVNLYKGGIFQQTLATNLLHQGITGISSEDWQRYFQNKSPYPSFALINVPDVPLGTDYTLEIVNGSDPSIRDVSDAQFPIITLPSPVTFKGRLLDRFTLAPIPNVQLGGYGTYTFMDGRTTTVAHPRTTTNSNGEFSFSTTTDHMLSEVRSQALIGIWPACYNTGMASLYRDPRYPITTVNIVKDFSLQSPNSSSAYKYFPLTSFTQDWGDQLLWPMTQSRLYTDIPVKFGLEYQNNFGVFGGGGNSLYKMQHTLSTSLPLDLDTRVKLTDQAGTIYVSPFIRLARNYGCAPKAISYMDGIFQWEPYPIGIGMSWTGGIVGTFTKATFSVSANAVAPLAWKMISGSLPPGMVFDATSGTVSGTPTTAGIYTLNVRVTDANGVRSSATFSLTIQ